MGHQHFSMMSIFVVDQSLSSIPPSCLATLCLMDHQSSTIYRFQNFHYHYPWEQDFQSPGAMQLDFLVPLTNWETRLHSLTSWEEQVRHCWRWLKLHTNLRLGCFCLQPIQLSGVYSCTIFLSTCFWSYHERRSLVQSFGLRKLKTHHRIWVGQSLWNQLQYRTPTELRDKSRHKRRQRKDRSPLTLLTDERKTSIH